MNKTLRYCRGQIWMIKDLSSYKRERGIQSGTRPYLIISSDEGNMNNEFVTCLACTSKLNKSFLAINVPYHSSVNDIESVVLCNQVRNISKDTLKAQGEYVETVDDATMRMVEKSFMLAVGITPKNSMNISELEKVVKEIAESKLDEIRHSKTITEDITIDIAAGLESMFSNVLRNYRKKEAEENTVNSNSIEDITPGLLKMHAFQQSQKGTDKASSEVNRDASETPKAVSEEKSEKGKGSKKRKPHGFWTTEKMKEFCHDKQTMKMKDFVEKWELDTTEQAINQYYNMKAKLNKLGISV